MNTLPAEFLQYWQMLVKRCHGNVRHAHNALINYWHAGESIPGYGTPQSWAAQNLTAAQRQADGYSGRTRLPAGWSLANLRRHQPSRATRILKRVEFSAGAVTRAGVAVKPWDKGVIESQFAKLHTAIATGGL